MSARARRILVGYDDSDASRRALDRAAALAGYGSSLTVVSVATNGDGRASDALGCARRRLRDHLVTATYLEPVGDAADELVAAVRAVEADLLVVGCRGGDPARRQVGSVSADVVRNAPCDVLVVR